MRYQPRETSLENQRDIRRSQTEAEQILWAGLRGSRFGAVKFRRQHRIKQFILDFYSPELELGIELDGEAHFSEDGRMFDDLRTRTLGELGIRIMRFENRDVVANPWYVLEEIGRVIAEIRLPSRGSLRSPPSPRSRGARVNSPIQRAATSP